MKFAMFMLLLALIASPACRAQAEQQEVNHHGMMHAMDVQRRVSKTAKLNVADNSKAQQLTVRVGPVDVPAHVDHMEVAQPEDFFLSIPFDGWLESYHPQVTDAHGRRIPNQLLHHVAFWNTARHDFLCPEREEQIFGAGSEMTDWPAVPGYGYRVKKGDRIRISTMFANPTGTNYPEAFLEIRIGYRIAGPDETTLKNIYPAWFDVTGCGASAYNLEPGESIKSARFRLRFSGKLIGVGGHIHQYGEWLTLKDDTTGETIAAIEPKSDSAGHILSVPVVLLADHGGFPLSRGDIIEVTDAYDNPTGKVIPEGAMGLVVGYFLPDDEAAFSALRRVSGASENP